MTTENVLLLFLCVLMLGTFGLVVREQFIYPIVCVVHHDTLFCPVGATWSNVYYEPKWEAKNCCP